MEGGMEGGKEGYKYGTLPFPKNRMGDEAKRVPNEKKEHRMEARSAERK